MEGAFLDGSCFGKVKSLANRGSRFRGNDMVGGEGIVVFLHLWERGTEGCTCCGVDK